MRPTEMDDDTQTLLTPKSNAVMYDEILTKIGEFGYYQKRVFAILCYQPFTSGILMLLSTFTFATPDHRCALPGYDNDTYFPQNDHQRNLINQSIPASSSCLLRNQTTDEYGNVTSHEYKCHSWVYDTTTFTSTFVTEFNLVCDDEVLKDNAVSILFLGLLVSYGFAGNLADYCGRKPVMVVGNYLVVLMSFLTVWTPTYTFLLVVRFCLGLGMAGQALTVYSIGLEIVGPSKRRFTGVLSNFTWAVGIAIMVLLGYLIRTWKYLHMGVAILTTFLLFFCIFVPESPRWLLTRGYNKKARVVIERVAMVNNVSVAGDILADFNIQDKVNSINISRICTSRKLLFRMGAIYFNWFSASIVYFGILLNLESLVGNIYLNMFLAAILESCCYLTVLLLVDKLGRRNLTCLSLLISGICLISVIFVLLYAPSDVKWIMTLFTLIGQFGVTSAFAVMWLWTGELFPTELRNFGVGTGSAMARLASLAGPYLGLIGTLFTGNLKDAAPFVLYAGFCIGALIFAFCFLPETVNQKLPETINDWENIGDKCLEYKLNLKHDD